MLLDDALDVAHVAAELREQGERVPAFAERRAQARPAGRRALRDRAARATARTPGAFERTMDGVSLDQPGLMLYTSGTTRQPQGRPAHPPQRRASTGCDWLRVQRAALDEGDVDLLWLPMSHIFGFGEACLGNTLGFTTLHVRPARRARAAPRGAARASS